MGLHDDRATHPEVGQHLLHPVDVALGVHHHRGGPVVHDIAAVTKILGGDHFNLHVSFPFDRDSMAPSPRSTDGRTTSVSGARVDGPRRDDDA
jgi:hypothetical protein